MQSPRVPDLNRVNFKVSGIRGSGVLCFIFVLRPFYPLRGLTMTMRISLFVVFQIFMLKSTHVLGVKTPYKFNDLLVFMAKSSNTMNYHDMQDLLAKLHFENCTETGRNKECNRCLSAKDLGFDANTVVNGTGFAGKATAIVYSLMPEKNAGHSNKCDGIPSLPSKLFETLAHNFTHGKSKGVTQHALEHILEKVNLTLKAHLHKKKCITAEGIFEEVKHSESGHDDHASNETEALDEDEFQTASAIIIYRLLQGYCISEHKTHASLPSPTFFIGDLYKKKKYLSEDDLKKFTTKLGIANKATTSTTPTSSSHDGHDHRRKRRAVETTPKPTATPHNATCYSLDSLMTVFDIDHDVGASQDSFKELCPALLQQFQSGVCATKKTKTTGSTSNYAQIWGYGFLSVTIISLVSLLGVATIPFVGKAMYKKVLTLLVALAVGSLAGDSVLHLIPHAFGLHAHEEDGDHSHSAPSPFIWKALLVLGSIYLFYLFEVLMHFGLKQKHTHSHVDIEIPGPSSHHMSHKKKPSCSKFEHHEGMPPNLGDNPEKVPQENGDIVLTNVNAKSDEKPTLTKKPSIKQSLSRRSVFSGDEFHDRKVVQGISAVAWMIIIGDTIHNISDGLAIGAAFSEGGSSGISGGISTSIAVFCHELPHELGDFAVLLTAGMSVKKALLANFLSACSCYIGLIIGIQVGQQLDVRLWIFAIAGGMFIYVALVDMLPDLMHSESLQTDTLHTFLFQNIGILLGFGIMLIIAVYEEHIMSAVKI